MAEAQNGERKVTPREASDSVMGSKHYMPGEREFFRRLEARHRRGRIGNLFNIFSVGVAGLALFALFLNVANEAFGTIGVVNTIEPETLTAGRALEALSKQELALILADKVSGRLRVLIRNTISKVDISHFTKSTVAEIVGDPNVDPAIAGELLKNISAEQQAGLLATYSDHATLRNLVLEEVVELQVIASFTLSDTIFDFEAIKAEIEGPILKEFMKRERRDDAKVNVIRLFQLAGRRIPRHANVEYAGAGGCTHGFNRLSRIDGGCRARGPAHRCRRGDLPRGVCASRLRKSADRDQRAQPGGCALDHLRHVGLGDFCAGVGTVFQWLDLSFQF